MKKFFAILTCCLLAVLSAAILVACGDDGQHTHSGGTANCLEKAICEECGEEYGEIDTSVHKSTEFTYSVNTTDSTKHDKKHKCCGALVETVVHSGGTATLDEKAKCEFCDEEYSEKLQPSITLDQTAATVTLGDTLILQATPFGIPDTLEWESDNESVATVEDGAVTAIKEGTANITVSGGGKDATCVVTVDLGGFTPSVTFVNPISESLSLTMLETVDVGAVVSFNGKEYDDALISYRVEVEDFFEIQGGVLRPKKAGQTTFTVGASWRDVSTIVLEKTVSVTVNNAVELKVNGEDLPESITLYTATLGGIYDIECDFEVTLKVNEENQTPIVSAEGDAVTIEGNTLKAQAQGEASITITYSDLLSGVEVDETIEVEVIHSTATYDDTIEWFSAYDGELLDGEGDNVLTKLFGTDEIESATQTGNIALDVSQPGKILGVETSATEKTVTKITVNAEKYSWTFNVEGYTFVIDEASDLLDIELTVDRKLIKGYFILKNYIDSTEAYNFSQTRRHWASKGNAYISSNNSGGFQGTFDGNGYAIDKLNIDNSWGFFGCAYNFTVKNLAFTNVSASGSNRANLFGDLMSTASDRVYIQNVYVQIISNGARTESLGIFASRRSGTRIEVNNFLLSIITPTNPCTKEYDANQRTGGVGLFKYDKYSEDYANNPGSWAYMGGEMQNMYIVSNQVYQRKFPLVQYKGVSVYAANDYAEIENGTKVTFSEQHIPSADEAGTDTLYHYSSAYRYNTFADLMDESKGNVQKVGNWKITVDGPVWEA